MSERSVEDNVSDVISEILRGESVEEAFCGFIKHSDESKKWKQEFCTDLMTTLWNGIPQESHSAGLKTYVQYFFDQYNDSRVDLLASLLETMVENNILQAKCVCESLLQHEKMVYQNKQPFIRAFKLIRKIIGGVDYKGCRDLLRVILEKSLLIPGQNAAVMPQVDALMKVVTYILDRNACLLPSYLAVNEITKFCPDDKNWPHWKLGRSLADFINSFRSAAQIVTISGRSQLLPVVGHSVATSNVWRLNPNNLRFTLNGPLPYTKEVQEPQSSLLRYVLQQPYSRDMVGSMLGLNKQEKRRCEVLEEQLVDLVVSAMEHSENSDSSTDPDLSHLLWQHLSSQLIYFVLFQFASFPHMVVSLYDKLKGRNLNKGRDHLMWVLLQFISGSIQKNPLSDFLPVLRLYDLLYPDNSTVALPDITKASSTHTVAATCIWIHLNKKAQTDKAQLQRPIPFALRDHLDALRDHLESLKQSVTNRGLSANDYKIPLLCNAYSTNTELFNLPMSILVESIYGNNKNTVLLPGQLVASAPVNPLPMNLLDSLTVHAKMSLIHSIVSRVIRLAKNKTVVALAPALVETYSRLLVYMEIESLGIKGFISQLLPTVVSSHAWGILHTLLEMFSYRLHHIQPHYRVQLLGHLHTLSTIPYTNQNQLHLCVESTALRLIMGLGSAEVQPQLSRIFNEQKNPPQFLSQDSEELNRVLVLTLARAMHVTGSESFSATWSKDILVSIMQSTPHSWPSHTSSCFPNSLNEFFHQNPIPTSDKANLKRNVESEFKKWRSMANENDIIAHFSMQGTPTLFLCIIWKSLLEENRINATAYKVLERIGPRLLSAHLRTFADFLVYEFCLAGQSNFIRYVEAINDMVWKCNILTIDRLVLCLSLRSLENNEAQVAFYIACQILVKSQEFKNRVSDFLRDNSPDHWLQSNWHEKHMAFHRSYPEKFFFEGIQDLNSPIQHQYLPVYFGNVCLRFLPVLDILIHRLIEMPPVVKFLELILDNLGGLYKFHDRPITYLYNTLHYYDKKLVGKPAVKRKLVGSVIKAHHDIHPSSWCLSEDYLRYLQMPNDAMNWVPEQEYFIRLIGRLVETIEGNSSFPNCDWRFNEFPNPAAHALHATCVELMALPVTSPTVGAAVLDVILKSSTQIPREKTMAWMNAVGLVLTALPESYWMVLNDRILDTLQSPQLTNLGPAFYNRFDFQACQNMYSESQCSYLVALSHAIWHHAGIGQLSVLPTFIRERVTAIIRTEEQFLFLVSLVGPFLQRFNIERTRCLLDLTVELYEILANVDKSSEHLQYMDPITDFLYHIKYMFIGDGVKNEVEKVIRNLRPALQMRLRFISHTNVDETPTPASTPICQVRMSQDE